MLLDIDVQGARKIKRRYPEAISVFILPPSMGELRRRLAGSRGTDAEAVIGRRLANARGEIRNLVYYDYFVVNDEVAEAVKLLESIVRADRAKTGRVFKWRIDALSVRPTLKSR